MNILMYIILLIVDAIIILLAEKHCKGKQKQFDYGYYTGVLVSIISYIALKYI